MVVDTCITMFSSVEFPLFFWNSVCFHFCFWFWRCANDTVFYALFIYYYQHNYSLSHSSSLFLYFNFRTHILIIYLCLPVFGIFPASNVPLFLHSITNSLFIQFFFLFNRWHKHTLDAIFHFQFSSHKTRMAEQKAELIESFIVWSLKMNEGRGENVEYFCQLNDVIVSLFIVKHTHTSTVAVYSWCVEKR